MKALDRKLLRDLWSLKAQVISIALVIACGIGGFVASFSTFESLIWSRTHYYDVARFPQVFAEVKRAPATLVARIRAIPGVSNVETRVQRDVQLDVPGVSQPMTARVIGMAFDRPQAMDRVTLNSGHWPDPGTRNEVLVNQRFADARGLKPGSRVVVLLNGKRERLRVVGTALSPEFIYATRGGVLPDDEWFAVLWMDAQQLAAAYNMEGAFNSVQLRLAHGASRPATIAALDRLLTPYGTSGAYGREDQVSDRIVSQEIDQLRVMGTLLPAVFLLIAAFIVNVVLHRQVSAQRSEIAALKALGYSNATIAWHYVEFASVLALVGVALGIAVGDWLGRALTGLYTDVFHFPEFHYLLPPWMVLASAGVALLAAFGGALAAISRVVRLRPADALRPPAPGAYRPLLAERLGVARLLSPAQRMVLRNLERYPVRALSTVAGIAGAVAILIAGTFWQDAVEHFIQVNFRFAQPADVYLGFVEPVARDVTYDLARLPGVREVEISRTIGARLRVGHRSYRTVVTGLGEESRLQRIVDRGLREHEPPPGTVLLSERLARRLRARPGDAVDIELMEGRRARAEVRVGGLVGELAGMNAYMRLDDLNGLAGEGELVSGAALIVDGTKDRALMERLKEIPGVATVVVKNTLLATFRHTSARNLLFFAGVLTAFAVTIAAGVVYNQARIQLAERAWELASLRVLGMTRAEASILLLGELLLEILAAIPLGLLGGYWLAALMNALMHGEAYEVPLVILPTTYLFAGVAVVTAGAVSALIVRHRIDHLDLVGVLKTRE